MTARDVGATMPGQSVSIVIVNKNDDRIRDTLGALYQPGIADGAEIVVVDASSRRFVETASKFPRVVWIDYVQPSDRIRTIAQQRNLGVQRSSGDTVVFLDPNCVPQFGWLTALVEPIVTRGELITVGSNSSVSGNSLHDTLTPFDLDARGYLSEFSNMNVAFRRTIFDRVGMFDEELGFAEDVDFAWRAQILGIRANYVAEAKVTHEWGTTREDLQRAFRYGIGRVRLYRKHRSRWRNLFRVDAACTVYAMYMLFSPISIFFPWYLLALAVPLVRNRRSHPFSKLLYHMTYSGGALAEFFHLRITSAQRTARRPNL